MLSPELQRPLAAFYGAEVDWTPQFVYILCPLGAFMFVMGLLVAAAALDPWRHRLIVFGLCGVLLLRALQRVVLQEEIHDAFQITPARDLAMAAFFAAEAVAILVLLNRAGRSAGVGADAATPPK
jgi:hypothetical protein